MGSPSIPSQTFQQGAPRTPEPTTFNGILGWVGGEYVADGIKQLPPPSAAEKDELVRQVVMNVPSLGAVRITYKLSTYRHGRSKFWHWLAVRADQVAGPAPPDR